ncbi:amino acid permease C-terminal domain-containing protein [Bacillus sp. FSL W8-0116]
MYPFLPALALIISICLLVPVGGSGFFSGLIWLSIGFAIYL